jgi:hypothetical protein
MMTEQEMRESKVPTHDTEEELIAYVRGLVDQDHDYGTCVYAMSMAATAAFNYVARKLGVTGFQASCADMDILRRTRRMEWFQIRDFADLLYPQYFDKFKGWSDLLIEHKDELAKRARALLDEKADNVHPNVRQHWERLAKSA